MNWIKQNTFLAGLLGVFVVGAGVFGFLIFSGKGRADVARTKIAKVTKSYQSFARSEEKPVESVLQTKQETVAKLKDEVAALQKVMIEKYGPKLAAGDAATFGQRVETRYNALRPLWEAEGVAMKVPNDFFLGFEKYRNSIQAQPGAVLELDNQLAALSWIVEQAVDLKLREISQFDREPVEGEIVAAAPTANAVDGEIQPPLKRYHLVATFVGKEEAIRSMLNRLVGANEYLFGIRYLTLKNTNTEGPVRAAVEGKVDRVDAAPSGGGDGFGFDFSGMGVDEGEAGEGIVAVDPYAGMSDAERRAAQIADGSLGTVVETAKETVGEESNVGAKADFTEQPGKQDAVVFLGEEDVVMTVVLDYVSFKPVEESAGAAE